MGKWTGFEDIEKPGYYSLSTDKEVYKKGSTMSSQQFKEWLNENPTLKGEYSNKIMNAIKADETGKRVSGKVKDAGPKFFNLFPGILNSTQEENSSPLMKEFEFLKREKGMSEGEARHYLENKRSEDPKAFEEEFNIGSYRDLSSAFDHGWNSAKVLDTSGILKTHQASMVPNWEDIKNLGTRAGEGIIKGLQYLDPFSSAYGSENKGSFILPEKKYRTSNVYDDIGQHSERRIREKQFSENYDYDKGTFLGIDGIEPNFLDIDGIEPQDNDWLKDNQYEGDSGKYITYKPEQAQTWLEKHNAAQREYNRVAPGANVTPWDGGGNITSAAVQGRRNEDWMNSLIGNYTMGIGKQDVKQNLINKYGTVQQQQNFADAIARKTHNPYANYDYFEGQGVDKADITADVTGMYTDSGSSGMDDIGDVTAPTDSWSDTGGTNVSGWSDNDNWGGYIARGGMVKDAPRYRYAEGGIVNLLPKGAW